MIFAGHYLVICYLRMQYLFLSGILVSIMFDNSEYWANLLADSLTLTLMRPEFKGAATMHLITLTIQTNPIGTISTRHIHFVKTGVVSLHLVRAYNWDTIQRKIPRLEKIEIIVQVLHKFQSLSSLSEGISLSLPHTEIRTTLHVGTSYRLLLNYKKHPWSREVYDWVQEFPGYDGRYGWINHHKSFTSSHRYGNNFISSAPLEAFHDMVKWRSEIPKVRL